MSQEDVVHLQEFDQGADDESGFLDVVVVLDAGFNGALSALVLVGELTDEAPHTVGCR